MNRYMYVIQYRTEDIAVMWELYGITPDEEIAITIAQELMDDPGVLEAGYEKVKFIQDLSHI